MRLGRGARHATTAGVDIAAAGGHGDGEAFDLVIAALSPDDLKTGTFNLEHLVNRRGTLVVITHGQPSRGLPYGPISEIVNAISQQGLSWHEHIVVESEEMPEQPAAVRPPVRTIHNDVLIFGRPGALSTDRSEDFDA
jgi:hypothetical protein